MENEIIEELVFNSKWLTQEYKESRYYVEYLDSVFNALKSNIKIYETI